MNTFLVIILISIFTLCSKSRFDNIQICIYDDVCLMTHMHDEGDVNPRACTNSILKAKKGNIFQYRFIMRYLSLSDCSNRKTLNSEAVLCNWGFSHYALVLLFEMVYKAKQRVIFFDFDKIWWHQNNTQYSYFLNRAPLVV